MKTNIFYINSLIKQIEKIGKSNFIVKGFMIFIIWIIALIPSYIYILTRILIEPIGFYQELAILVVALFVIGWLQAILLILGGALSIGIILEN